jgi:hypothetical protein
MKGTIGTDLNGVTQPDIAKARQVSEARRQARLGKKASEATRAKLRVINSRPRGKYHEIWDEIYRLCGQTGFRFQRIRNYWLVFDENNKESPFHTSKDLLAFLRGDGKWNNRIYTLCTETGYEFRRNGNVWEIYHDGKQVFRGSATSAVQFLQGMKKWLLQHRMLPR